METQTFAYDMCRGYVSDLADTHPFKSKLLGFIRGRELERLCGCSKLFDMQSNDIDTYRSLLQVEAFFKKNEAFSNKDRCLKAAQLSFDNSELLCKLTNKRLDYFYLHQDRLDPDMKLVIRRASAWIRCVLGDVGGLIEKIPSSIRVTAGATAGASRRKSLPFMKVKRNLEIPPRAVPYAEALFKFCNLKPPRCKTTTVNRVEFVPKNWKTYRTIACEPEGAVPFQLAFDSYVKGRLRKYGINLLDQSRNQELARQGSIDGSFATIDLSSASDTVSLNCCAWLFPTEWFQFIKTFRSDHYLHPVTGEKTSYEKFSSMGNGMTFGIETLVFAALLRACGDRNGVVYGDDICVGVNYSSLLLRALKFFGFKVNLDKTFMEGPYRESCGTHWFNGSLITPFFVRGNLKLKPFQAHNVNGLVTVGRPEGKLWSMLREYVYSQGLLITAYNPATTSGVWIDFRNSVLKKKTSSRNWIYLARRYEFRTVDKVDTGIRSLILWYHDSFRIMPERKDPYEARVRSRYSVPLGRYRQRRVVIHKYDESAFGHIPLWSTFLFRES